VPEKTELQRRILQAGLAMGSRVTARLRRDRDLFESLRRRLVDPRRRLDDNRLKLDDLTFRMEKAVKRSHSDAGHRLQAAVHRLTRSPALLRIRFRDQKHKEMCIKLPKLIYFQLSLKRKALAGLTTRLSGVSPLGVLERGYSITRTLPDRRILRNAADAATGQELEVLLARGRVRCTVKGTLEHDPERKTDGV
jgi:exodeoxyribonuclease VII large subunit